ncbi:hypothetical protein [Anaerosinus sp.]
MKIKTITLYDKSGEEIIVNESDFESYKKLGFLKKKPKVENDPPNDPAKKPDPDGDITPPENPDGK